MRIEPFSLIRRFWVRYLICSEHFWIHVLEQSVYDSSLTFFAIVFIFVQCITVVTCANVTSYCVYAGVLAATPSYGTLILVWNGKISESQLCQTGISIGIFNNMNFFKRGKSIKMKTKWRLKICLGIPIKYFAWKPVFCTESSDLNLIWSELEVEVIKFGSIFPQNLPNGLLDPSPFVTST